MKLTTAITQGVRPEIQALRAIAVLLVLIYHFWPTSLPGGYAGVDVFFVISGFLITSHLLREVTRTGTVKLGQFWARRARRLLPASLLVIVVSAVGTILVAPITFWQEWFKQIGAAVGYVLNWLLAVDSVDYLAAENKASLVQHYWSLSVEEQFYLVWPLLIILGVWLARKGLARHKVLAVILAGVTIASFVASVVLTVWNPAEAYFVTPTRAWEFGLGGLLAFLPALASTAARSVVAWAGFAGLLATGLLYTSATPFPGYAALLPVLATAAVIWAGVTPERWSLAQLSRFRPIQYVGDISYSLYLWHWPLIVLVPFALGRALSPIDSWLLFFVSFALAAITKRFVEDPGRSAELLTSRRPAFTFSLVAASMVVALAVPAGGFAYARAERIQGTEQVAALLEAPPACLGADVMAATDCVAPLGEEFVPNLAALKTDNGNAYRCYSNNPQNGKLKSCTYGSEHPDATRVAITGDSHGALLLPALLPLFEDLNWNVDTYVSRGCTWGIATLDARCRDYATAMQERFESGEYDIIITTASRGRDTTDADAREFAEARAVVWAPVIAIGTDVVAIGDNPLVPAGMADCVIERPVDAVRGEACVLPEDRATTPPDSLRLAVELEPRAHYISTTDLYCAEGGCPMVIGNVVVYRDEHHISATYARTVGPHLVSRMATAGVG
ncbi:acyltransferase family protein [Agromyces albus]|uniref:acyltransferase family protein n=1 Tax=Agromyces albus TaxID=205332 RepID=UPI002785DF5E|nr:acyltransferase family protein [Agromyces albus]MDQ0574567.1 peptidoglycan/LPS O-acetylase OafA/YrhL [Agromyces albus]